MSIFLLCSYFPLPSEDSGIFFFCSLYSHIPKESERERQLTDRGRV